LIGGLGLGFKDQERERLQLLESGAAQTLPEAELILADKHAKSMGLKKKEAEEQGRSQKKVDVNDASATPAHSDGSAFSEDQDATGEGVEGAGFKLLDDAGGLPEGYQKIEEIRGTNTAKLSSAVGGKGKDQTTTTLSQEELSNEQETSQTQTEISRSETSSTGRGQNHSNKAREPPTEVELAEARKVNEQFAQIELDILRMHVEDGYRKRRQDPWFDEQSQNLDGYTRTPLVHAEHVPPLAWPSKNPLTRWVLFFFRVLP
jgi:hypothetical protein